MVFCFEGINFSNPLGWCLSGEDSVYLGKTLHSILFWDQTSPTSITSLTEELDLQLGAVCQRDPKLSYKDWEESAGWRIRQPLSLCVLDPAEDVDRSNWLERGHFRPPCEE